MGLYVCVGEQAGAGMVMIVTRLLHDTTIGCVVGGVGFREAYKQRRAHMPPSLPR